MRKHWVSKLTLEECAKTTPYRARGKGHLSLSQYSPGHVTMSHQENFDCLDYLKNNYGDPRDQRARYLLEHLHDFFKSLELGEGVKVLDYGSGPVVQNVISIAAFAAEIVFSDIFPSNREAVQKWLDRDADAFDWSPHFDYVVKTLEGKTEEEARQREERMRKISKVVFCDSLSENMIESGYEGPYDIILQCACLESSCGTKERYEQAMKGLISLLKPGGWLIDCATDSKVDTFHLKYQVGVEKHGYMSLSGDYVVSVMKKCGLCDLTKMFSSLEPESWFASAEACKAQIGFHTIYGRKTLC